MNKKSLYLFLALVLPGLIFVFLKFFGRNEFDVQVYHADKVEMPAGCAFTHAAPYTVPDSVLTRIGHTQAPLALFWIDDSKSSAELNRLSPYRPEEVDIAGLGSDSTVTIGRRVQPAGLEEISSCFLLLHKPWNAVLVDQQRRIRGYYLVTRRDEVDRLMLEIDIILKKY